MTNPVQSAASIVKASPGTMAFAVVGLAAALLGVEAAKALARKTVSLLNDAKNRAMPGTANAPSAATGSEW